MGRMEQPGHQGESCWPQRRSCTSRQRARKPGAGSIRATKLTISLPSFSGFWASSTAATTAAPLLMPHSRPSSCGRARRVLAHVWSVAEWRGQGRSMLSCLAAGPGSRRLLGRPGERCGAPAPRCPSSPRTVASRRAMATASSLLTCTRQRRQAAWQFGHQEGSIKEAVSELEGLEDPPADPHCSVPEPKPRPP